MRELGEGGVAGPPVEVGLSSHHGRIVRQRRAGDQRSSLEVRRILASALLVAMATAIGTGLGSGVLDLFDGSDEEPDPISYSASEQISECGTALFIPAEQVSRARSSPILDWEAFRKAHGGAVAGGWEAFRKAHHGAAAGGSVVQVSIQGKSARTATLTGIDFMVKRRPRPPGAIVAKPCGGSRKCRSRRAPRCCWLRAC